MSNVCVMHGILLFGWAHVDVLKKSEVDKDLSSLVHASICVEQKVFQTNGEKKKTSHHTQLMFLSLFV